MSNIHDFASIVDLKLHDRIFLNDPKLMDSNVYMNRKYSGTLQQLYIIKNWDSLVQRITPEELWAFLKIHEYRSSKLVFDSNTGDLIADRRSQDLYKRYYNNSLWSDEHDRGDAINIKSFLNFQTLFIIIIFLFILFYISNIWEEQNNAANNILDILQASTIAQQWTKT